MNWDLWQKQALAVLRLELRKTFLSRRGWWIYLLAFAPVVLFAGHALQEAGRSGGPRCSIADDYMVFAGVFQIYFLRLGIFFGCVGIFTNLFRSEVLEKTLHYYYLAPLRREVLVVGKYLAGVATAIILFGLSVAASYLALGSHFGAAYRDFLTVGPGLGHLFWYELTTVLACFGYGAVFLTLGLIVRNPMIPAAVVMVWESINLFLPPLLKKFSIIFYLQGLCPVQNAPQSNGEDPLQILKVAAQAAPPHVAILGLLLLSAMLVVWSAMRVRKTEVSYSD